MADEIRSEGCRRQHKVETSSQGGTFQVKEEQGQGHRVQGRFAPVRSGVRSLYGKGKEGTRVLGGPVSDLRWSLNGMPRMLSPMANREIAQDFK